MPVMLAFAATAADQRTVTTASCAVASVLGLQVEARRLGADRDAAVADAVVQGILDDVASADVALIALPYSPGHAAHLVTDVIQRCPRPVLVVPVLKRPLETIEVDRVLVPLNGTALSADTVAEAVDMFCAHGIDVVVLHVFDESTVPKFWDQAEHARKSWAEEFLARFCDRPNARLELRSGAPGANIVDVAVAEHADLIALGWAQNLSPGHARAIRAALANSAIPVLLLPQSQADDEAAVRP
ncbi:MAG TPA: universal stress protein [Acidothermaceae bacterium]|nr:universal stress protein [Acidothermaceae bacterium]